jgi:hypothetical protein
VSFFSLATRATSTQSNICFPPHHSSPSSFRIAHIMAIKEKKFYRQLKAPPAVLITESPSAHGGTRAAATPGRAVLSTPTRQPVQADDSNPFSRYQKVGLYHPHVNSCCNSIVQNSSRFPPVLILPHRQHRQHSTLAVSELTIHRF